MKNLVILVLFLLITTMSASATTIVHYNGAGIPTHSTVGLGHRMSSNPYGFGSNAIFTPENRAIAGERIRMRKLQQTMAENSRGIRQYGPNRNLITPPPQPRTISSLDRNYRIRAPKSYVRNGIIYYY